MQRNKPATERRDGHRRAPRRTPWSTAATHTQKRRDAHRGTPRRTPLICMAIFGLFLGSAGARARCGYVDKCPAPSRLKWPRWTSGPVARCALLAQLDTGRPRPQNSQQPLGSEEAGHFLQLAANSLEGPDASISTLASGAWTRGFKPTGHAARARANVPTPFLRADLCHGGPIAFPAVEIRFWSRLAVFAGMSGLVAQPGWGLPPHCQAGRHCRLGRAAMRDDWGPGRLRLGSESSTWRAGARQAGEAYFLRDRS